MRHLSWCGLYSAGTRATRKPCCRIAGLLPTPSTDLSSGKRNPARLRPDADGNGRTSDCCCPIGDGDSEFAPVGLWGGPCQAAPGNANRQRQKTQFLMAFRRFEYRDGDLGASLPGNQAKRRAVGWACRKRNRYRLQIRILSLSVLLATPGPGQPFSWRYGLTVRRAHASRNRSSGLKSPLRIARASRPSHDSKSTA